MRGVVTYWAYSNHIFLVVALKYSPFFYMMIFYS